MLKTLKHSNNLPIEFLNLLSNNRRGCTETDIAVYYVPGNVFGNGKSQANFHFEPKSSPTNPIHPTEHSIIMSDKALGRVLAHEIGHALLLRPHGGPCSNFVTQPIGGSPSPVLIDITGWGLDEPDATKRDPSSCSHNTDPKKLMEQDINPGDLEITPLECTTALGSQLANGIPDNFRVDFQKIDVVSIAFDPLHPSINGLWRFRVLRLVNGDPNNVILLGEEIWNELFIGPDSYTIGKSIPFSIEFLNDIIRIEVSGTDINIFGHQIPLLVRDYDDSSNWGNWGIGSNANGELLAGPINADNNDFSYNLHYRIFSV